MKKVWNNAVIEELEVQATAQETTSILEFDGTVRAADGKITGYIVGYGAGSGIDTDVILHEKVK